jgi:hypothetical protein
MTTAETHSPGEYEALLRADFASFVQHCFRELNPRAQFALSWHHEIIAAKLEAVRNGDIRRTKRSAEHRISPHSRAPIGGPRAGLDFIAAQMGRGLAGPQARNIPVG